jgi:hypothetical protein
MGRSRRNVVKKAVLVCFAVFMTAALGGRFYRSVRVQEVPPTQASPSQPPRPTASVVLDISQSSANDSPALEPHAVSEQPDTRSDIEISVHPIEQFRNDLTNTLAQRLIAVYPRLPDLNHEAVGQVDPAYRDSVFQFLDAANQATDAQKPAMLLAADLMLQAVWCPLEPKIECDQLRTRFAEHKLTLTYSELGGGSYYQHDLLWRVWHDFPETEWGERAFVLLLDWGWDTSGTCAKGSDQFREVIRQGELFLQQHRDSRYRDFVIHLVGQAYATWWSLSQQPTPAMADYVDPKLYQEGSEQARLKAIGYFEQVLQHSPGSLLGEYARQFLPILRQQQLTIDSYRFFCVYD